MMELIAIERLKPATYNPRTADNARLDMVELSLKKLGFVLPIFATRDGEIISGHQRHLMANKIGLKKLPVIWCDDMDLPTRKAVNIAERLKLI